ncbi:hypothetical protein ACTXT7_000614 [Hymenolepis weldensis]
MSAHSQFGSLAEKWSYESVAKLLLDRSGSTSGVHLWIIRASRWSQNTLAFYDNFVRYNSAGAPDYSGISNVGGTSFAAWRHLDALMINAVSGVEGASIDVPCAIIGFSKGCSVMNQLIYEMGLFFDEREFIEDLQIPSRVFSLTWLDSGHNGVSHLWPTWTVPLARLRHFPSLPKLFIFATPYQQPNACYAILLMRSWLIKVEVISDSVQILAVLTSGIGCIIVVIDFDIRIPIYMHLLRLTEGHWKERSDRPWNFRDFNTFLRTLQAYRLPFYSDTFFKGVHWQCPPSDGTQMLPGVSIEAHFEILDREQEVSEGKSGK